MICATCAPRRFRDDGTADRLEVKEKRDEERAACAQAGRTQNHRAKCVHIIQGNGDLPCSKGAASAPAAVLCEGI